MRKENCIIRLLYNTSPGRLLLKALINPSVSNAAGIFLSSVLSKPLIDYYIKKHKIDMSEYEECKYKSFNDFFTRKKKHISVSHKSSELISPCDGYLSVYNIDELALFSIKNSIYDLRTLLKDEKLAERYRGGTCFILRLTPHHFHRYLFVDNGNIVFKKSIPGVLHCVRPIACCRFPVYIENQRVCTEIQTEAFGTVIQMEIGAILVGRIHNHPVGSFVYRGQEKGFFEFGGSTIILLTQKDTVSVDKQIMYNTENNIETEVHIGEKIAEVIKCDANRQN